MDKKRWVIGISGASGAPVAAALLKALYETGETELHVVVTRGGELTLEQECGMKIEDLRKWADQIWDNQNLGAAMASGSWKCSGMAVVPCSMKTVAGIANGFSENLLLRAADVMLKERRPLILVARETPFSTVHLKNMLELSRMGVTILPPVLSYYNHPGSIEDATDHIVGQIMDCMGYDYKKFVRWGMNDGK